MRWKRLSSHPFWKKWNVEKLSAYIEHVLSVKVTWESCDRPVDCTHAWNDLYMPLQSAYRQNCSTETTLLHVHDSVIRSIDERKGVILLLIDLSAAFDMIDHAILLNTLSNTIGVKGRCFVMVRCLHTTQTIHGVDCRWAVKTTQADMCPARVSLWTTVVHDLYDPSCVTTQTSWHDWYADDIQLFQEFSLTDNTSPEIAIRKMERCVISMYSVRVWINSN